MCGFNFNTVHCYLQWPPPVASVISKILRTTGMVKPKGKARSIDSKSYLFESEEGQKSEK